MGHRSLPAQLLARPLALLPAGPSHGTPLNSLEGHPPPPSIHSAANQLTPPQRRQLTQLPPTALPEHGPPLNRRGCNSTEQHCPHGMQQTTSPLSHLASDRDPLNVMPAEVQPQLPRARCLRNFRRVHGRGCQLAHRGGARCRSAPKGWRGCCLCYLRSQLCRLVCMCFSC